MTTNPFDDEGRRFLVLVNDRDQHSLWPADMPPPPGWHPAHAADTRAACLDYVDALRADPRPASLAEFMKDS